MELSRKEYSVADVVPRGDHNKADAGNGWRDPIGTDESNDDSSVQDSGPSMCERKQAEFERIVSEKTCAMEGSVEVLERPRYPDHFLFPSKSFESARLLSVKSNALPFPCRGLGRKGQGNTNGREGKGREIII